MDAVTQDIKDQTLWVIATMERTAEQAAKHVEEGKKSGWAVLSDLATAYGEQKALNYRKKFVKELEYGLPAAEAVQDLLDRVTDDVMAYRGDNSSNGASNLIQQEEHVALLALTKELRNAQQHIARSAAVTEGLGTGVLTQKQ